MPGRRQAATRSQASATARAQVLSVAPSYEMSVEELGAGDWIRQMLYSYPGWGKTVFITSSARTLRTLIIRSSMDLVPARALHSGAKQIVADNWEKMLQVQDYCRMQEPFPYDWVWWDCASIAQDVLLDDIWQGTILEKPGRAFMLDRRGQSTGQPNLSPTSGLDRGEYGRNMERIQQWVRHMVGCNRFHFGITAHPFEGHHPTNDEGGTLLVPYIQGKNMTEKICGYMNMVGFMEVVEEGDEKFRKIHFAENSRFYAKDHYEAFLPTGAMEGKDLKLADLMTAVERARGSSLGQPQRSGRRGTAGRRT